MKDLLIYLTLVIIYSSTINCFDCPDIASLGECKCYANVQTIQCYNVSSIKLDIRVPYKALIIHLSRIKILNADALGNATFETLTINNNPNLEYIDYKIFINNNALKSLIINHNPRLGPRLLEIGKYLTPATESITFVDNGIATVPDYAFKPASGRESKLKSIYLNNNTITSVGAYAFDGLARIEEIRLDHNFISTLDAHSFYINTDPIAKYTDINLNHNALNLLTNAIMVNGKWTIDLYINYNGLKTLREVVYKTFFENNRNKLHSIGNAFVCDCATMKWIVSIVNAELIRLQCNNFNGADISSLTANQLCP